MPKPKMGMSFNQRRKELLERMASSTKGEVQTVVIPFQNRDVPNFLEKLNEFEQNSRKSKLRIN